MTKFIILLRGINVGGNKKVPMKELLNLLLSNEYTDITTILATGNVIASSSKKPQEVESDISSIIEDTYGFGVNVQALTQNQFEDIYTQSPFLNSQLPENEKGYVTFVSSSNLPTPPKTNNTNFGIVTVFQNAVFSTVNHNMSSSIDLMDYLEGVYGSNITTRTWQTITRIHAKNLANK